jgi:hypothetical protein
MRERVKCVPKLLGAAILLAAGLSIVPHARAQTAVGLELALLADVSASVSTAEYNLMLQGYVQAFQSAAVQEAIINGPGSIAVTYIEWSAGTQQSVQVNWTLINSAATANAFAAALAGTSRAFTGGNTAPGSAINFAYPLFSSNAYTSDRLVIDIAGDGAASGDYLPGWGFGQGKWGCGSPAGGMIRDDHACPDARRNTGSVEPPHHHTERGLARAAVVRHA